MARWNRPLAGLVLTGLGAGALALWWSQRSKEEEEGPGLILPDPAQVEAMQAELELLNRAYALNTQLQARVQYRLYAGPATDRLLQEEEGELLREGQRLFWKLGGIEVLQVPGIHLTLNRADQTAILRDGRGLPDAGFNAAALTAQIGASMAGCLRLEVRTEPGGFTRLLLDCPPAEWPHLELRSDRRHLLDELVMDSPTAMLIDGEQLYPRMVISYRDTRVGEAAPAEKLDPARYLTASGETLSLAPNLQGFRLRDLRGGGS